MRLSRLHLKTLREAPNEAELVSHKLMIRANLIKKEAAGIYTFMPFGWRTIRKIEEIVRQEQDRIGCQELHMPHVNPSELWKESDNEFTVPYIKMITDKMKKTFPLFPSAVQAHCHF